MGNQSPDIHSILFVLPKTFGLHNSNGLSELAPGKLMLGLSTQPGFLAKRAKDVQGLVGAEER